LSLSGGRVGDARLARRLTLAWAGVVFAFAVLPTHAILSPTIGDIETLATQAGHFVEFAVLAALAMRWSTARSGRQAGGAASPVDPAPARAALTVWGATVAYGAFIEAAQVPLTYRSAQLSDLAIDAAGALAGLLLFSCGRGLRARGGRRRPR